MRKFEEEFLMKMDSDHKSVLDDLSDGKYSDELTNVIETVAAEISKNYKA